MLSAMARPPQRLLLVCLSLSPCLAESIYLFLSPSIHLYNDLHTHIRARTHARTHSHTHTHTLTSTHTCAHTYTQPHTGLNIDTPCHHRRAMGITNPPGPGIQWGLHMLRKGPPHTHTHPLTHVHKCTTRTHAFHPLNQARIASRRSARSSSTKSAWPGCTSAPKEKLRELTWRN